MAEPTYSNAQIAAAALIGGAGATDEQAVVLVAIALAESGANPKAVRQVGSCQMRGAWQINSCAHPQVLASCAFEWKCSAAYALTLYKAQGGKPWSTFTSGAYRAHLPAARSAVGVVHDVLAGGGADWTILGTLIGGPVGGLTAGIASGEVPNPLNAIMRYIVRAGAILAGAALILLALYFLAGGPNPVQLVKRFA